MYQMEFSDGIQQDFSANHIEEAICNEVDEKETNFCFSRAKYPTASPLIYQERWYVSYLTTTGWEIYITTSWETLLA